MSDDMNFNNNQEGNEGQFPNNDVQNADYKSINGSTNSNVPNEEQTQGVYYSYTPNSNEYMSQNNYQSNNPNYFNQQKPPKKNNKALKITLSVLAVIAVVVSASLLGYWAVHEINSVFGNNNESNTSSQSSQSNEENDFDKLIINSKPSNSDEFKPDKNGALTSAAVIKKVRPSIVGIVKYVNSANGIPNLGGEGSGIIISSDGYIITNAHVVANASMITVVLDNDEEYRATLKGIDTQTDLAVIKIEKVGLVAAELGNSTETVLGESVIAIGNPGGLDLAGSCTQGIISGLNRNISDDTSGTGTSYIQTDAAINPGNSGGALVNMYGQVIGINSAKIVLDGFEGLGFAIPINEALPIVNDLQKYGYVKNRAKIGIVFQPISDTVSQYYNGSIPPGLLINKIDSSCDIAKKDVEVNDIITKIDGKKVTSSSDVYSILKNKKPGDKAKLTIFRLGARVNTSKTFKVEIILSENKGE